MANRIHMAEGRKKKEPLNCPYCGSESARISWVLAESVMCLHCHAEGPVCKSESKAVSEWNRVARVIENERCK